MDAKLIAKYLTALKEKKGLTYEAIAEVSGIPEATVKNLCTGKTEKPGIDTISDIVYAMGGSVDEMFTGKKDAAKEISISSIKEMYEFQLAEQRNTEETRIMNIRADHEQHRNDVITNYERLLSEKDKQINLFKKVAFVCFGIACIGLAILITILILEVTNPDLGWIKF